MTEQFPNAPQQPQGGMPSYQASRGHNDYSTDRMAGEKAAQLALILGIVGLFFAGIVLGPLAIWQASKAEKMGSSATPGKVLGWISTLWGIGQLVIVVLVIGGLIAVGTASLG